MIERQTEIIQKKLDSGQRISDILSVNAVPGYSERHFGRALDLNTAGCKPVTEMFEATDAFNWLE